MTVSDWTILKPESAGLNGQTLQGLVKWLDSFSQANVHSVVVVRGGKLVFEHYRTGADQRWGVPLGEVPHSSESKHDLRSVTKSVMSLLIGIALDRNLISGIDEPIFNWFPEYSDLRTPEKERISLRHLLTMSPGFEWDEYRPYTDPTNSEVRMLQARDQYRYVLDQPVVAPPGQIWNYNSGCSALVGAVIAKATKRSLDDAAREYLLEPLGITDFEWTKREGSGFPEVGGLRLSARDLAKIGQLVLSGGTWNGRRIVSQKWIDESTSAHIGPADRMYFYGYQWWLGRSLVNQREVPWVGAIGLGGQRIFAVPACDMVVVVAAGLYSNPLEVWVPLVILNRYVLGALVSR